MKTILVTLCALLSLPTFCLEEVILNGFSAEFEAGQGTINADEFNYQDSFFSLKSDALSQDFQFLDGLLSLNLAGVLNLNYQLDSQGIISKLGSFQTMGVDLHYIPDQRLSLKTSGISLSHSGGSQYLPELEIECKRAEQKAGLTDILNPCLELGRVEIPILDFDQLSSQSIAKALTGSSTKKGIEKIEDISLLIFNENFQLSFKAKFLFQLKIKAQGQITYNEEIGAIDLYLSKAKVGIFSIKGRLLKELREANISGVEINGSHIIFKL